MTRNPRHEFVSKSVKVTTSPNPNDNPRTGDPGTGLASQLYLQHEPTDTLTLLHLFFYNIKYFQVSKTTSPPWTTRMKLASKSCN